MSLLRKLAGQTAIYGLSSILGRLLNYLLVPLYTRVFDTGDYGMVTQFYAYASFLNVLFTYGLETAFFRFYTSENGRPQVYSTALISIIASSVGFMAMILLFVNPIAESFPGHDPHVMSYVLLFAGILAADAITAIPFARLRQQNRALRFAFVRLVNIGLNIGFNLFFLIGCPSLIAGDPHGVVASWYDPTFGVGYVFLANLLASLVTLLLLVPEMLPARFGFDGVLWKKMIRYGWPLMIAGFAGMVNETFDRILLPYLIKDPSTALDQLGIYGACYKLSILMTLFVQTFRYAAEPFFFNQAGRQDAKQIYARVMDWFLLAGGLIFLGVTLFLDVFGLFIGEKYRSGLSVVPILLLANWFLGVYLNLSMWYKLTSKTSWGAWFALLGAIVTLVLNVMLIPTMGYEGAAWATLVCYATIMVASYGTGQREYPVPYDVKMFFISVSLALGLAYAGNAVSGEVETVWMVLFRLVLMSVFAGVCIMYLRRKSRTLAP